MSYSKESSIMACSMRGLSHEKLAVIAARLLVALEHLHNQVANEGLDNPAIDAAMDNAEDAMHIHFPDGCVIE